MDKLREIIQNPNSLQSFLREKSQNQDGQFINNLLIGLIYGQFYLKQKDFQINPITLINLPEFPQDKKGTLLLDLDETLMTTNIFQGSAEQKIKINKMNISFSIRPFAKEMLSILSQSYEIFIFTGSKLEYAQEIVKFLDPNSSFIHGIFDRQYCYQTENGVLIKDLRIFNNRSLDKLLLVDNTSLSFGFQSENGIPVTSWLGDPNDQELRILTNYLLKISEFQNLRQANSNTFQYNFIFSLYTKFYI